ncbi:unnamed protein product [Mucor hiemalis]
MYNNNNNSHPDPYAGQYPAPPPLVEHQPPIVSIPMEPPQPSQPMYSYSPPQPQDMYPPQPQYPPQQHVYSPPIDYYNYNPHMALTPSADEERHLTGVTNDYHRDNSLDDYLRQERAEYLKHEIPLNEPIQSAPPKVTEEEKTPMVLKESSPPSRKERKRIEKLKKQHGDAMYAAYVTKPTVAPENEAETYRPKPYEEQSKSNCCCCYNPAITCCSFFCLLISVAFFAAGVALMIASKVVTDKCNNQCASVIDQAQEACGTLCSKVLHDGMLYGGAVVAGLAGIAIIWKLIMWTCAGYSKR